MDQEGWGYLQVTCQRNQCLALRIMLSCGNRPSGLVKLLFPLPTWKMLLQLVIETFIFRKWSHGASSCCCAWLKSFSGWALLASKRSRLCKARNCKALTALAFFPIIWATVATSYPRISRLIRTWRCSSVCVLMAPTTVLHCSRASDHWTGSLVGSLAAIASLL